MTSNQLFSELELEAQLEREEEGITLPEDNEDLGKENDEEITEGD